MLSTATIVLFVSYAACSRNSPPAVIEAPFGPTSVRTGITAAYYGSAVDPDGDSIAYRFDWGNEVSAWNQLIGPDDAMRSVHCWADSGLHEVRFQARDARGLESDWSPPLLVTVDDKVNHAPRTPSPPLGRLTTAIGVNCAVTASTTDPDGDSIAFQFLWGNGDTSEWTPPVSSGDNLTVNHEWQSPGLHVIRVRARDTHGAVSNWSRGRSLRISRTGTVKWRYLAAPADFACPAIAADGTLYINSESGGLLALSPEGVLQWRNQISSLAPASILDDTTILAALGIETATTLRALRPDGSALWEYAVGSDVYSAPAIDFYPTPDSPVVYLATVAGQLHAINADGTERWSISVGPVIGSPAIGIDHTVYLCSLNDSIVAVNPDGTIRWRHRLATSSYSALAVATDGTIYSPTTIDGGDFLLALTAIGTERWRCPIGWSTVAPVIGPDGTIYLGSHTGTFYAVSPLGRIRWSFTTNGAISSPAVVTADHRVCFGSADSFFYCLDANGTLCWRLRLDVPVRNSPPAVSPDGTIYFRTDNWLYAIHGEAPLATSQWPKFQSDRENTGRAGR